jgi:hypothetical protein
MDLAEVHIRDGGCTGFSFRNLAAEVGIKSASVSHQGQKWLPPSLDVTETASWLRSRHSRMKAPKMRSLPTGQPSERHSTGMVGCVFAASAPRLESYRLKSQQRYNLFFAVVSMISRVGSVGLTL